MLRPAQPTTTQRWVAALVFAVVGDAAVGVAAPSAALAQTTLVVRGDGRSHASIAVAADDALFDATGSSAHRVEVTLEDLALAAGCTGEATDPACIAAIAAAAHVDLVAIEYLREEGETHVVHTDLRDRHGARLRFVDARCAAGRCRFFDAEDAREASRAAARPEPPIPEVTPLDTEDPPETSQVEIRVSTLLFAGATLASIGALVAGVVGLNALGRADVFRQSDRMRDLERLAAAEEQRDVALGTATAFTVVGAALALTGLVLALADSDTRVAAIPLADGALLELRGAF
jgi:hypothetical protein